MSATRFVIRRRSVIASGLASATALAMMLLSGGPAYSAAEPSVTSAQLIEMMTPQGKGFFYTASAAEAGRAQAVHGFKKTGTSLGQVAIYAFPGSAPTYRLRHKSVSSYILTVSESERARLIAGGRFVYEGVVAHIKKTGEDSKRIYRLHSTTSRSGGSPRASPPGLRRAGPSTARRGTSGNRDLANRARRPRWRRPQQATNCKLRVAPAAPGVLTVAALEGLASSRPSRLAHEPVVVQVAAYLFILAALTRIFIEIRRPPWQA
ncbi:hypothetical protein ACFWYW_56200 [Nonomuraea sp. NPDC059023]|uniref:hypothetical protein n=1 Tax=unclassified Nonomuraea TaxID=2593643 RepID=UPI0036CB3AC8